MFEGAQERTVSEIRAAVVEEAIKVLGDSQLLNDLEAVLLFGSTARGDSTSVSDVDIFCVTKDGKPLRNPERIIETINEKAPDVVVQIGGGSRELAARFLSRENKSGKKPAWKVLFSQNKEVEQAINFLIECSKGKR